MQHSIGTDRWVLVYKRGFWGKCMSLLQTIGMACFALLFAGGLFLGIMSLVGRQGLPPLVSNITEDNPLSNKALYLVGLLIGSWLAYDSIKGLVNIIKDLFNPNCKYEGILTTVTQKSVKGIHINYKVLVLECNNASWETWPRLKLGYLLQPGKAIRVIFSGGTRTIKKLWVSD